jgi:hypothetical protein
VKYFAVALLAFVAGLFVRGCFAGHQLAALQVENDAAKVAAHVADSLRVADRAAFDAERAGLLARVSLRSIRSVETGTAAASLVDTLYLNALPDCKPALTSIAESFRLHLTADDSLAAANAALRLADSLELVKRAAQADTLSGKLAEAMARTDRAIAVGRSGHGWKTDVALIAGTALVVVLVRH